jgi:hypothetical protein
MSADNFDARVKAYFDSHAEPAGRLILDLLRAVQQKQRELDRQQYEPVTAEQTDFVICYPGTPLHWHMQREDLKAIALYRQLLHPGLRPKYEPVTREQLEDYAGGVITKQLVETFGTLYREAKS